MSRITILGVALCLSSLSCNHEIPGKTVTPADQAKSPAAAAKKAAGKLPEEWGWQDLQDYLASKGWKTSRGAVDGGMLFHDGDGTPINMRRSGLEDATVRAFALRDDDIFMARHFETKEIASARAAQIKDVEQRDVLAWDRFIFEGSKNTRAKLKKTLPP